MSKQKRGMFRRLLDAGRKMMGAPVTRHYPDPMIRSPEQQRRKKRTGGSGSRRFAVEAIKRWRYPKCEPGTIAFHDKCVLYYGRRKADQFARDYQHKDHLGNHDRRDRIPTEANFAAMTPWAWREA